MRPQLESHSDVAQTADYLINLFPTLFLPDESTAFFAAFCQHPIIYHCFHYVYAVHRDVVQRQVLLSRSARALWHLSESFRLLNAIVGNLDRENIELALLTIVTLVKSHIDPDQINQDASHALLFTPHNHYADSLHVYGRTGIVEAHANAIVPLVHRAGGLNKLKFPGLSRSLAMSVFFMGNLGHGLCHTS